MSSYILGVIGVIIMVLPSRSFDHGGEDKLSKYDPIFFLVGFAILIVATIMP